MIFPEYVLRIALRVLSDAAAMSYLLMAELSDR